MVELINIFFGKNNGGILSNFIQPLQQNVIISI